MTSINMHYFAALRDATQISEETLTTDAVTAGGLFAELKSRYDWPYEIEDIKPAINDRYVSMDQALAENDRVVFIPPVAGG